MNWSSLYANSLAEEKILRKDPDYKEAVSVLLQYVGKEIETDYGCIYDTIGSSAYTSKAISFLSKNGYTTSDAVFFSEEETVKSLKKGRPLLINGYREYDKKADEYRKGHAWLLDGYVKEKTTPHTMPFL